MIEPNTNLQLDPKPEQRPRTKLINKVIEKRNYQSYLEIGLGDGRNFNNIRCKHKESVDPAEGTNATQPTHVMTSDVFFSNNKQRFDLIFIDGLHHSETVYRDICNALDVLSPGGMIICHDMNPTTEVMQAVPRQNLERTGDCWKAWIKLRRERPEIPVMVANTDYGLGIIFPTGKPTTTDTMPDDAELTWQNFEVNRQRWLNLVPAETAELWATS